MRVGVVVNPVAGMGGRVGLKGTDGKAAEARARGAEPRAPARASTAVEAFVERVPDATILAGPGRMGADEVRAVGADPIVVGDVDPERTQEPAETTAADTRAVVRAFLDEEDGSGDAGVDLVLFVGGDGTAVDVAAALEEAGVDTPMLGVPAGVKVYSGVFAVTPREAGRIAAEFDRVEEREINDIDEDAFRGGEVHTELQAVRPVPVADGVQATKQLGGGSVDGLVDGFVDEIQQGTTYVFGPGSTVGAIERALGIDHTALGVDVWRAGDDGDAATADASAESQDESTPTATVPERDDAPRGRLLVTDGAAEDVRSATADAEDVVVVVSPIGGQGFVLGRGNQQITPDVVRDADLEVVGSRAKLDDLGALRIDTDDAALDEQLRGWTKVRIGRVERRLLPVE